MKSKYFFQLILLSALWGAGFLLTRIATPVLGPSVAAACRIGLGAATLALIMWHLKLPWPSRQWRELLLLGALAIALPHFLYAWSSLYLPAGYSAVVGVTSVLFGAFAAAWMKEDTLTWIKIVGCIAAFAGVALVVKLGPIQPSPQVLGGTVLAVGGCLFSGLSMPLLKRATKGMEPLAITAGIHVFGFLLLLPGALWALPQARFTLPAMSAVAAMGVVTSGLAYWQYMRIMNRVSAVAAHSSTFMVTIFGVIWGHLFLDEVFTAASYTGGALVLIATMMVTGFNPFRRAALALAKP
jgi:drug/metabolite transporter (DMT)-like permease